jgi:glutamate synthase (NADPH/NADH) large chain
MREILPAVMPALENQIPVDLTLPITNVNRVVGTIVGSEVSKRYGEEGLPEETITLRFTGSAGQSFGAFVPNGMSLHLTGDTNDFLGKGLSGGKLIVKAPAESQFEASENVIAGNVALIGATSGEAYINGRAGERFAVRNSGANVVVEGIGDHGCEYMTGGRVVILGNVGKNFGAGMSGGIAYVLADDVDQFKALCNTEMIEFEALENQHDVGEVWEMILNHFIYTGSAKAGYVIENWEEIAEKFVKVIPKDYKRMMEKIHEQKQAGFTDEQAIMSAFQTNSAQEKELSVKKLEAVMQ